MRGREPAPRPGSAFWRSTRGKRTFHDCSTFIGPQCTPGRARFRFRLLPVRVFLDAKGAPESSQRLNPTVFERSCAFPEIFISRKQQTRSQGSRKQNSRAYLVKEAPLDV